MRSVSHTTGMVWALTQHSAFGGDGAAADRSHGAVACSPRLSLWLVILLTVGGIAGVYLVSRGHHEYWS